MMKYSIIFSLGLVSLASTTLAATTTQTTLPTSGTSTTSIQKVAKETAPLPLSISVMALYYGPLANKWNAGYNPNNTMDDKGEPGRDAQSIQYIVPFKYKLNAKTTLAPTLDFSRIVTRIEDTGPMFSWNDNFIKLSRTDIIDSKFGTTALNLGAELRYYAPTSKGAITSKSYGVVRTGINPTLTFAKTGLSLQLPSHVRYYMQSQATDSGGNPLTRWRLYAGQQLNYELNNRVTFFALYENDLKIKTNGTSTNLPSNSIADFEPGMEINVHNRVSLIPYLNWYTNQPIATTSINLTAIITLL